MLFITAYADYYHTANYGGKVALDLTLSVERGWI